MSAFSTHCDSCGSATSEVAIQDDETVLVRCLPCGLYYLRSGERQEHHKSSPEHQARAERYRTAEFDEVIATLRQWAPAGPWLDIGCGCGGLVARMLEHGIEAHGIDVCEDRVWWASTQRFVSATHETPEQHAIGAKGKYAAITMINVFSHLPKPSETFQAIRDLLMPGGVLLIRTGAIGPGLKRRHLRRDTLLGEEQQYLGLQTIESYAFDTKLRVISNEREWWPLHLAKKLHVPGRSEVRNAVKRLGTLPVFHQLYQLGLMARYHGPIYVGTSILMKP